MKNIILNTIKTYRLRLIGFSAGATIYIIVVTDVFQNFMTSNNNLGAALKNMPSTIRSFIHIGGDFLTPAGYLGSEPYYVLLPIVMIILAIGLGASIIKREETHHTLELLLSRPISRTRVLFGKALGAGAIILIVNLIALIAMIIFSRIFNMDISILRLAEVHLELLLLSLIFGALALAFTAVGHKAKELAIGVSALIAIGGYILASLAKQVDWLEWPAKVLPYHYYDPNKILHGSSDWPTVIGFAIVITILLIISWLAFRRRDIN